MKIKQNYRFQYFQVLIVIILLYFNPSVSAQDSQLFMSIRHSDMEKEIRIKKLDSLLQILEFKKHDSLHHFYQQYAYWLYDVYERKRAIDLEQKSFDFVRSKKVLDTIFAQQSALYLGIYQYSEEQYLQSIKSYNEGLLINNTAYRAPTLYYQIGDAYLSLNDYLRALEYYEFTISLFKKNPNIDRKSVLRDAYHDAMASCLSINKKEYLLRGEKYGKAADSMAFLIPTSSKNIFDIKTLLAQINTHENNLKPSKALQNFNNALEIAKKENDSSKIAESYIGLGDLYNILDKKKSIKYLEKAESYAGSKDSLKLYQINYSKGHTLSIYNEYEKGIDFRHKGIGYLTGDNLKNTSNLNYDILINANTEEKFQLLRAIPQLAETYLKYFEVEKNIEFLNKSIVYYKLADFLIDLLKLESREFKSRLFWREISNGIYSNAIKVSYLLGNIEDAFFFMEKNKTLLLLEDIVSDCLIRLLKKKYHIKNRF